MAAVSSTIAAVSAIAGAVSAGYSIYQGRKQEIEAKKEQKKQQAAINTEKQSDRRRLLSQQRYQMGLDSDYSTSGTSSVGRGLTTGQSTLG